MTIRFAAAHGGKTSVMARSLCPGAPLSAANDNRLSTLHRDAPLGAALLHFARHGLSAATLARAEAEDAHYAGNLEASAHWLEVCRQLDRRMAAAAARRLQA